MPEQGWDEIAEALRCCGKPWPLAAVVFDLRWHEAIGATIPGRPALVERWAWTAHRVRVLLAEPARWRDPLRAETENRQSSPADRQRPTPGGRTNAKKNGRITSGPPTVASNPPATPENNASNAEKKAPYSTDTVTVEVQQAVVVRGVLDRPEFDEARPEVVELVGLQRREGQPLIRYLERDTRALLLSLRGGRSLAWHHRLMVEAERRNVWMRTWSNLLSVRMAWLADLVPGDEPSPPLSVTAPSAPLPLRRPGEW
jgi:hypothetical protein